MILADANIISIFCRVRALKLLWELFSNEPLGVTPAVLREINDAVAQGCAWLREIPSLISSGSLQLAAPLLSEILAAESLPDSLGLGEREAIALCLAHAWAFLTNDRRARNYCRELGVEVFDLAGLLHALWLTGVRPKSFVRKLADQIERTEGLVFKNKELIFQRHRRL
jgi:predicted nucleic acid-binding protein